MHAPISGVMRNALLRTAIAAIIECVNVHPSSNLTPVWRGQNLGPPSPCWVRDASYMSATTTRQSKSVDAFTLGCVVRAQKRRCELPRINIEPRLFTDQRFFDLVLRLGNSDTAIGALVRCWILAQKYYLLSPHRMVPKSAWDKQRLPPEIIETGMAEVINGEFVRVAGADEMFAWLLSASEAGKRSGKGSKNGTTEIIRENPEAPSRTSKHLQRTSKQLKALSPSLSLSLSPSQISLSNSNSSSKLNLYINASDEKAAPSAHLVTDKQRDEPGARELIAVYVDAFRARYGSKAKPAIGGKVAGQAKRLVAEVGFERSKALVEGYLSMNDAFFISRVHDFGVLVTNLNKVGLKVDTGRAPTAQDARSAERIETTMNQLEMIKKGEL